MVLETNGNTIRNPQTAPAPPFPSCVPSSILRQHLLCDVIPDGRQVVSAVVSVKWRFQGLHVYIAFFTLLSINFCSTNMSPTPSRNLGSMTSYRRRLQLQLKASKYVKDLYCVIWWCEVTDGQVVRAGISVTSNVLSWSGGQFPIRLRLGCIVVLS